MAKKTKPILSISKTKRQMRQKCAWPKCNKKAVHWAAASDSREANQYCMKHAIKEAGRAGADYVTDCPHCKCMIGTFL